uniref:Reverse transcriptase domain-containing protein n=1 Tax=Tanacetum cinerariifolium TaxID=118510 RepID=A0A6L2KB75_TANCI|nr:hypothetical protein [Tanacetum cinerariifolium]
MRTRSSSNKVGETSMNLNPKGRNRRRSKQRVEPFSLEETPVVTMADERTMEELLRAPTEGYAEAIVVPPIPAEHFELKHRKASNVDSSEIASAIASAVTSAITVMFKQHQVSPAPAFVKVVEESCDNYSGADSYRQCPVTHGNTFSGYQDNIQGYVSAAAVNYNQGNTCYRPQIGNTSYQAPIQQTQVATSSELEKFKKTNENQNNAFKNELTNNIKNMMASFFQMSTASSSGSGPLPSNTIANLKGELKAITTRSGIVLDGPSVPMPPPFSNLEEDERAEDERAEETLTDPKLAEYTIKESDPRVTLNLERPFLRTARALIDVYGEELILCDDEERLILNMKHDTSSYSNKPQRESINMIDIYNISYKDYLEDLFANEKITNHLSGNPTFSLEPDTLTSDLTSPEVNDDIFDPEGDIVLIEKLLNLNSTKDLPPSHNINPLSGSTTSFSPSLTTSEISDYSLEEFADELALIESFSLGNDDMTPEDVIREIEYLLNRDPLTEYSPNNDLIYTIPEIFLPYFLESDLVLYEDFYMVDTLTSTDNEDKLFNPGILVYENLYEVTNRVAPDKNVKKISSSNDSLILEDYNPPLSDHELPFHIEIPSSETLLSFSSKNKEKVFNPRILISKGIHSLLPELSHRDSKAFKVINIFESPMEIFPCFYEEDIRILDVSCLHFIPVNNSIRGTGQA